MEARRGSIPGANPRILLQADEGALPPGLREKVEPHLEPGEALRWVGRSSRWATLVALLPILLAVAAVFGCFLWAWLSADVIRIRGATGALQDVPTETLRPIVAALIAAPVLYYSWLVARRIAGARTNLLALTDRRVLATTGGRAVSFPVAEVDYAEAEGPLHRPTLMVHGVEPRGARYAQSLSLFGVANIDAALAEMAALGIAAADNRKRGMEAVDRPGGLALGEAVRWSGRRGVRAFDSGRLFLIAIALPLPLLFFWGLTKIWSVTASMDSGGIGIAWAIGMSLGLCSVLGPSVFFTAKLAGPFLDDLLVDCLGSIAVTDRRILFTYPLTGIVDRHVTGDQLIDATLVAETPSGRGQIALTLHGKAEGSPESLDLFGVPDARRAAEAMSRLVRSR